MEEGLTQFTVRILLLFLPGVICSYLVDSLTAHRPREAIFFILRSFAFGFASYFFYWLFLQICHFIWVDLAFHFPAWVQVPGLFTVQFFEALVDEKAPIDLTEIFLSCVVAVVMGLVVVTESTYKVANSTCRRLGITKQFGELDVWGFTFNVRDNEWVTVRDLKHDLVYDGYVAAFSDDGKDAELLLYDVIVYRNTTSAFLYSVKQLYVSRDRGEITLEFRADQEDNSQHGQEQTEPRRIGAATQRGNGEEGRSQHDGAHQPAAAAPTPNPSDQSSDAAGPANPTG